MGMFGLWRNDEDVWFVEGLMGMAGFVGGCLV